MLGRRGSCLILLIAICENKVNVSSQGSQLWTPHYMYFLVDPDSLAYLSSAVVSDSI